MTVYVPNPLSESLNFASPECGPSQGNAKSRVENSSLPRFNLRKRNAAEADMKLPTVNSAFLSCLFADVANARDDDDEYNHNEDSVVEQSHAETSPEATAVVPTADVEESALEQHPAKKSRLSMSRSISRCAKSYANLDNMIDELLNPTCLSSPTGVTEILPTVSRDAPQFPLLKKQHQHDSLHFQLSCVSQGSSDTSAAGEAVFPHLPATVSNSSCSTLTRNLSDLQSSLAETDNKEAYGWFVVMDDDSRDTVDAYARCSSSTKLAFEAPTAPNAENYDAEVEWAQAADTVDDVLGDFF